MSTDTESQPEAEDGLRKSFWEHLDDLRKAVIRSLIAIGIALVLCLLFVDKLVGVLEYPLRRIALLEKPKPAVSFQLGPTRLGPYTVTREQFPALPPGDAPHAVYEVGLAVADGRTVPTLTLLPAPPGPAVETALQVRLHNFGPSEGFLIAFHVALFGALILSAPFWMYYLIGFILPALNPRERQALFPWIAWGVALFFTGVVGTYFFLLPLALRASLAYSNLLGFEGNDWRANDYISFVGHFVIGMGLGFQFPLVVLFLVKIGLITHRHLAKYRRHVIVLNCILGAVLTTPEVITMVAMAVPLCLLYEACIWIAWYWDRKKRRAAGITEG